MQLNTLTQQNLAGKRVLVRVDYNVPLDEHGNVTNDKRLLDSLPTLNHLLENNAKLVLLTHLGRPKDNFTRTCRTCGIAKRLSELLGRNVKKVDNCIGPDVEHVVSQMKKGEILMLDNVRFYGYEKCNKKENQDYFARKLANCADVYVNEAFSCSHRCHASMTGVPKHIPGCVGFNVEKEVKTIKQAIENPARPFVSIIGGLKADKGNAIKNMLNKADKVLIGGALAFLILKEKGYDVGKSKIDKEGLTNDFKEIIHHEKLVLPVDAIVSESFDRGAETKVVPVNQIQPNQAAFDIGPETVKLYKEILSQSKTVVWNGPMGRYEYEEYLNGTKEIAECLANSNCLSVIGGGDSAAAIESFNLQDKMSIVSTGGGASLTLIEGKELPAIEILKN